VTHRSWIRCWWLLAAGLLFGGWLMFLPWKRFFLEREFGGWLVFALLFGFFPWLANVRHDR
jgi:hypothetical protein